jgi:hypothetical protein
MEAADAGIPVIVPSPNLFRSMTWAEHMRLWSNEAHVLLGPTVPVLSAQVSAKSGSCQISYSARDTLGWSHVAVH